MGESGLAKQKTAALCLLALCAAALLFAGILFLSGVRMTEIDAAGCEPPPEALRWEVVKFESEGTALVEGWAVLPGAGRNAVSVTVLLRDPQNGVFYRVPTAVRALDGLSAGGEGVADALGLTEDEAAAAGFFARGVALGASAGGKELYLLYDDGAHRYLINTNRSASK